MNLIFFFSYCFPGSHYGNVIHITYKYYQLTVLLAATTGLFKRSNFKGSRHKYWWKSTEYTNIFVIKIGDKVLPAISLTVALFHTITQKSARRSIKTFSENVLLYMSTLQWLWAYFWHFIRPSYIFLYWAHTACQSACACAEFASHQSSSVF